MRLDAVGESLDADGALEVADRVAPQRASSRSTRSFEKSSTSCVPGYSDSL